MRILHFSDFHLRPNGLGKRSMDIFNRMMEKFQEINQEENIDLVIFWHSCKYPWLIFVV